MLDISVLLFVMLIAALYGLAAGIALWITGREPKNTGAMSCGRCNYPVRGLETFNCPECGEDLRVVGINRPIPSILRPMGTFIFALSCFVLLFGGLGLMFWDDGSSSSGPPPSLPPPPIPSTPGQPVTPWPDPLDTGEIDLDTPDHAPPAVEPLDAETP
ncbi:MAG: hypothetical protein MI741_02030 [Rhodospirillales bacterium]|nr:hypothetical protein [Rhodospirillales bacterium]